MARSAPTQSQIISDLAEHAGVSKAQVKALLEKQADDAAKYADVGYKIHGIAKIQKRKYKARQGRNPQTGESIKIPARTKAKATILKALKDRI